jgi:hypothetical protein
MPESHRELRDGALRYHPGRKRAQRRVYPRQPEGEHRARDDHVRHLGVHHRFERANEEQLEHERDASDERPTERDSQLGGIGPSFRRLGSLDPAVSTLPAACPVCALHHAVEFRSIDCLHDSKANTPTTAAREGASFHYTNPRVRSACAPVEAWLVTPRS